MTKKYKVGEHPEFINEEVLNQFFKYLIEDKKLAHNTAVGYHKRVKSFLIWLFNSGVNIHPSFRNSSFNELNEHLYSSDTDLALNIYQYQKLLELKKKIDNDEISFPSKADKRISVAIKEQQLKAKKEGIKITLDCFLWMCSLGMYISDIQGDRDNQNPSIIKRYN